MKEVVRYGFILGIICAMAGGSLAIVNSLTRPIIIAKAKAEEEASLRVVMAGGERFEPVKSNEEVIYYKVYNKNGEFIGAAFKAQGRGYASVIETMVGMTGGGRITAIKLLSQNETPGLGNKITESSFTMQFGNKDIREVAKIQAITGASISSRAVMDSVKKKAQEIKKLIENSKRTVINN